MADVVQYRLERMVNELDDLERRGIFTRTEIAEIVKQRRKFEYRLKRPSPLKQDFLDYIDYEKQVERLRLLRKKEVARELKKQGNKKMKKSISDYSGVARIVETYRQATNRFKGDLQLWFQYLEFCRERSNGRMKKVLAQVIRFHPKVPGVWIYAAAWEFDQNLNAAAARALMQSGLRSCPTSEDLWVEYLRMELTYLNKLKARRVALGEDEGTLSREHRDADGDQWKNENKELFMPLDEKRVNEEASDAHNEESDKKLDMFKEQGLSILSTVYRGSVAALPSNFGLRKRFLEILEATDLAHSEEMRNDILADMKRDFLREPEYPDWLARHEITDTKSTDITSQLDRAIQVFEEAIEVAPSALMFSLYASFLKDIIVRRDGEAQNSSVVNNSDDTKDLISRILVVYEKAESMGFLTEELACQHVSLHLQLGKLEEARILARKLCDGKLSDAVNLWALRFSMEIKCVAEKSVSPSKADLLPIFELLKNVLTKMNVQKAESLWLTGLKFFSNQKHYFNKLVELSLLSLTRDGGSDDGFSLSCAIVDLVLQRDGIQCARDTYKRFLALPHPGLALYNKCIELEANLTSVVDGHRLRECRKLYETALATYDQDLNLWQSYYSLEIRMGTSETANAVYWRAKKLLKEKVAFLSSECL